MEEHSVGQVLQPEARMFFRRQSSPTLVPKMSSRVRTRSPVSIYLPDQKYGKVSAPDASNQK